MGFFDEIEQEFRRLRRRLLREVDRVLSEHLYIAREWTSEGSLRPLYTLYEQPDKYTILIDLAAADTSSLEVKVVDDLLVVEAKLERDMRLGDIYGDISVREVVVRSYRSEIPLPLDADPSGMKVEVLRSKIVKVDIPRRRLRRGGL
ncbi:MAG: Hsp20 family protein [Thermoproteota archaeon]